jgi:hypothetical protein
LNSTEGRGHGCENDPYSAHCHCKVSQRLRTLSWETLPPTCFNLAFIFPVAFLVICVLGHRGPYVTSESALSFLCLSFLIWSFLSLCGEKNWIVRITSALNEHRMGSGWGRSKAVFSTPAALCVPGIKDFKASFLVPQ